MIRDKQIRVCKLCFPPGHILRDYPEFNCHKCGAQGHYARECDMKAMERYKFCYKKTKKTNKNKECICNDDSEQCEKD